MTNFSLLLNMGQSDSLKTYQVSVSSIDKHHHAHDQWDRVISQLAH
jgi:hypothetical protein